MKTLMLIAALLAANPTDAGTPDAGKPDAGDVRAIRTERRVKLLVIADDFQKAVPGAKVKDIYFAAASSNSQDAAIIVAQGPDGKVFMNFFIFMDGSWQIFPSDFRTDPGL